MTKKMSQKDLDKLTKPEIKFFDVSDPKAKVPNTVALVSYPRSGNTLLRAYLDKIMGIATGSGGSPGDKLIIALKEGGFAGETITDKRVHVIKTHSPERSGRNKFPAERAILLVRSPLDVLIS